PPMPSDSQPARARSSAGVVRIRYFIVSPRFWVLGGAGSRLSVPDLPASTGGAQRSRAAPPPSTGASATPVRHPLGSPPMPASLDEILVRLRRRYGEVRRPGPKDAYEQVLYECACYLVDDARREEVWRRLKQEVGVSPEALLDVPASRLAKVLEAGGMKPPM